MCTVSGKDFSISAMGESLSAINLVCLDPKYRIEHAATSRAEFGNVLRVLVDNIFCEKLVLMTNFL